MKMLKKEGILRWGSLVLLLLAGCSGNRQFGYPQAEPCAPQVNTKRVQQFDPYPDPNIGPSSPGVRPRWFETPSQERYTTPKLERL
ncbi:MAG: hypothetical protein Q4D62_11740 [Planctomycetia bacterium]|nr:hypothetical protein [Planctomycetia bacterium]